MRYMQVERFAYTPFGTFGRLRVWEQAPPESKEKLIFECFTVEPPWQNDEAGKSCVPLGRYPLKYEYSEHFKRELWELKDLPEKREEAKIHPANLASQLRGCIAPGLRLGAIDEVWAVRGSSTALEQLHAALAGQTETYIVITNGGTYQGMLPQDRMAA